jgi:hydroxyisourate hydrolase
MPAQGIEVELHAVSERGRRQVATAITNADGRTNAPLIDSDTIEVGTYELTFHVADYFRRAGLAVSTPPFLDAIVIRIGVADATGRYHVPLLVSPYGYSTYRGS